MTLDRPETLADLDVYDLRPRPPKEREAQCRRFFEEIYRPSFDDPAIREDLETWLALLSVEPTPPLPRLHVIVAVDRRGDRMLGGFVCEYYARSGVALGTYLVVAPEARGRGVARRLLAHGRGVLARDVEEARAPVPPGNALAADRGPGRGARATDAGGTRDDGPVLFAETEAPRPSEPEAVTAARLAALARLGFLRCELPYVQPPLGPGKPPVNWLLLLVHRPRPALPAGIPAATVQRFLRDFYEALGVADPDRHEDYRAMRRWLAERDPVPLLPLESVLAGPGG